MLKTIITLTLLPSVFLFCQDERTKVFVELSDKPAVKTIELDGITYEKKRQLHNVTVIGSEGKTGLIDEKENVVIAPRKNIKLREEPYGIKIKMDNLWGLLDKNGRSIIPINYKRISYITDSLLSISDTLDRYGLYMLNESVTINPKYCAMRSLQDKGIISFIVSLDCENFSIINFDEIDSNIDYVYQQVQALRVSEKAVLVKKNEKKGILGYEGEIKIPIEYDKITPYQDYFIGEKEQTVGIKDYDDSILVDFKYYEINKGHSDSTFIANLKGNYGVIDIAGSTIIPFEYQNIKLGTFDLDGYQCTANNLLGLVSHDNRQLISPLYYDMKGIYDNKNNPKISNYFVLDKKDKWAIINREDELLTNHVFDEVAMEGLFSPIRVRVGDKIFSVDKFGRCISDCPSPKELEILGLFKSR